MRLLGPFLIQYFRSVNCYPAGNPTGHVQGILSFGSWPIVLQLVSMKRSWVHSTFWEHDYVPTSIILGRGHNLWLHVRVDEHPFATYFDVHQEYRVLTHSHFGQGSGHQIDSARFQHLGSRSQVFFSYHWPSSTRLGPDQVQRRAMNHALELYSDKVGADMENIFIWLAHWL